MPLFGLDELADAAAIVRRVVLPTPAYAWPLLAKGSAPRSSSSTKTIRRPDPSRRAAVLSMSTRCFETGRGQTDSHRDARQSRPIGCRRGDAQRHSGGHRRAGGNSSEKNAATAAFGGELSLEARISTRAAASPPRSSASAANYFVPSFHRDLVKGVATYAHDCSRTTPSSTSSLCRSAWARESAA